MNNLMAKKRKLISEVVYPHLEDPTQCQARYSLLLYLAGLELFVHLLGNRGSDGMFFSPFFAPVFSVVVFYPRDLKVLQFSRTSMARAPLEPRKHVPTQG